MAQEQNDEFSNYIPKVLNLQSNIGHSIQYLSIEVRRLQNMIQVLDTTWDKVNMIHDIVSKARAIESNDSLSRAEKFYEKGYRHFVIQKILNEAMEESTGLGMGSYIQENSNESNPEHDSNKDLPSSCVKLTSTPKDPKHDQEDCFSSSSDNDIRQSLGFINDSQQSLEKCPEYSKKNKSAKKVNKSEKSKEAIKPAKKGSVEENQSSADIKFNFSVPNSLKTNPLV